MLRRTIPHAAALACALGAAGCPRPTPTPPVTHADSAPRPPGVSASPAGEPTGALRDRVEAVAQAFRERNGRPLAERWVDFVVPNGSRVMRLRSAREQCLGLVAVGRESLSDINLTVRNEAALVVGADEHNDAHPYVRVCLRAGQTVLVEVQAVHGAGEVAVLTVADPPVIPPNLDAILGARAAAAFNPPRTPRVSVGSDPAVPPASEALDTLVRRLTPLGYRRVGPALTGSLEMPHIGEASARLEAGRCYAVAAAGGPGVEDLNLQVRSPENQRVAQDVSSDNRPTVRFCAEETGTYAVLTEMRGGAGDWAAAVMEMDPAVELPADVVGQERALSLELAADARRHGMALSLPALRGLAVGLSPLSVPVDLRAGRCYLFGAAASELLGAGNGGVDLALVDDHGAVASSDTAARELARVYYCAHRDVRAHVDVRPAAARGEFLLLGFESRESTP